MDYISRSPEVGLCPDDAESLFGNIKAIYHFNRFAATEALRFCLVRRGFCLRSFCRSMPNIYIYISFASQE